MNVDRHLVTIDDREVSMPLRTLRARIETDPAHPLRLVTVRRLGYKIETGLPSMPGLPSVRWVDRAVPGAVQIA